MNWITDARKAHENKMDVTLSHEDAAFLAARLRRLFFHFGYTLPAFAKADDAALIRIAGSCIGGVLTNAAAGVPEGDVVVTKNPAGQIVAVTRQDAEGRILSVIAESTAGVLVDRHETECHQSPMDSGKAGK